MSLPSKHPQAALSSDVRPCALVTGAGGGVGTAIVGHLLEAGWRVVACDIRFEGPRHIAENHLRFRVDVASAQSVTSAVDLAVQWAGGLDAVVTAAGICELRPFEEISEEEWQLTHDVNLKGVFLTVKAAIRELRISERGAIVNIASDAGLFASPFFAHYGASKFGVVGLTMSLAAEFGSDNVTVNAICPGVVEGSPMTRRLTKEKAAHRGTATNDVKASLINDTALGRLINPNDVAAAVVYLVSMQARSVSGIAMLMDGGANTVRNAQSLGSTRHE